MSTLYVDNLQPNLGSRVMAAGHVVQVVSAQLTGDTANASTTYADTGLSASITPTSTTSKVLILVSMSNVENSAINNGTSLKLVRDTTDLNQWVQYMGYSFQYFSGQPSINYLDSPSTTSSTTYKVQFRVTTGGGSVNLNANAATSTITLMEIAQ
jgi:hypothetical protein